MMLLGGTATNDLLTKANSITFNSGAGAYTLQPAGSGTGSGTLTIGDASATNAGITNNSSNLQKIQNNLALGVSQAFAGGTGGLQFGSAPAAGNGGVDLQGNTLTTNGTVDLKGIVSSSSGTGSLVISGGTTTFEGVNSYTGDTFVNNGTLAITGTGSVNTSSTIRLGNTASGSGNATLALTASAGGQSLGNTINPGFAGGTSTYLLDSQNTSGTNTVSGNIFLDNDFTINQAAGGSLSVTNSTLDLKSHRLLLTGSATSNIGITGVIGNSTGSGRLQVGIDGSAGGPIVTLSNANTYKGDTFVRAGSLAFTSTGNSNSSVIDWIDLGPRSMRA